MPLPFSPMGELAIEVERIRPLVFADGAPVRAASGVARFGGGWLVVQDDGTHAALVAPDDGPITPLRIFPPVEGLDHFAEHDGTKHLKPDLEAACDVTTGASPAVIVLGSGSTAARCRGALISRAASGSVAGDPSVSWADLGPLYQRAMAVLGIDPAHVNFEGLSLGRPDGSTLRWFNRGNGALGIGSASVEVSCRDLLLALAGELPPGEVAVGDPVWHELDTVDGVALAVTDAVWLGDGGSPGGAILISSAAEDTPNNVDDGPVVGTALSILAGPGARVVHHGLVPLVDGQVPKIEGLALLQGPAPGALADGSAGGELRVLAVVDADDALIPSSELVLRVSWGPAGG